MDINLKYVSFNDGPAYLTCVYGTRFTWSLNAACMNLSEWMHKTLQLCYCRALA